MVSVWQKNKCASLISLSNLVITCSFLAVKNAKLTINFKLMYDTDRSSNRLYPLKADITRIQHCAVPGLITSDKAITFEKAINGTYEDTHVGASFGPT